MLSSVHLTLWLYHEQVALVIATILAEALCSCQEFLTQSGDLIIKEEGFY